MNRGILFGLWRRLGWWLSLRGGLHGIAWLGLGGGAALLLDAALDLPAQMRILLPCVLGLGSLALLLLALHRWRHLQDARLARLFEQAAPTLGSQLINAVQLAQKPGSTPVQEFLRQEALELGRHAAAQLPVWPVVEQATKRALAAAGLALVLWLGLLLWGQSLLQTVVPRFLDPHGDHPPYSSLQLEVSPGPAEVLYGGQVEIRAKALPSGADKLWLATRSGTQSARTMMFLAPDKTFFQTLANLREPTEYCVTDGHARSHRFHIAIRYTPQITLVEVTTVFPAYTGKPSHTSPLSGEAQALPLDTQVRFRIGSNRPLKGGTLTLTPVLGGKARVLHLTADKEPTQLQGGFTLSEAVLFTIQVQDTNGLSSPDPQQGRFNILPDQRPRLFVLEPGRNALATPRIRVPVRVQATDDYGISRVLWLRSLNHSTERPGNMKLDLKAGPQSVEAAGELNFAQLGVRPGDVVEYYFEAADNDPRGPNLALSRPFKIQIISEDQYAAVLRQAAARKALFEPYFKLGGWLQRLAERARHLEEKTWTNSNAVQPAAQAEAAALAQELQKYEAALGDLMQPALLFDVEQSFRTTLALQHTQIGQIRRQLEQASSGGHFDASALAQASDKLNALAQTETEEVSEPARQIAAVAHLMAQADAFAALAQQQAALAQMLRRFADKQGALSRLEQMELQELTARQQQIQSALHHLLSSLPEQLAQLPQDPPYAQLRNEVNGFLEAVRTAQIESDLHQTEQSLAAQAGPEGYQAAQRAAAKMDQLLARCDSSLGQEPANCLHFKPSLQQALGNTLEQILAALGAGSRPGGQGSGPQNGYSLFNEDVTLYGPDFELAGSPAAGPGQTDTAAGAHSPRLASPAWELPAAAQMTPGRVHLQPDGHFPLRYREVVGEYFRVIGESQPDPELNP